MRAPGIDPLSAAAHPQQRRLREHGSFIPDPTRYAAADADGVERDRSQRDSGPLARTDRWSGV